MRKKCSSDREKLLKFEAGGREFAKHFTLLEQFIQTVKGQNNFGNRILFFLVPGGFSDQKKNISSQSYFSHFFQYCLLMTIGALLFQLV